MRKTKVMLAAGLGLALGACQTTDWGAVTAGTGLVLAGTGVTDKTDPKVAEAGREIARYCPALRIASAVGAAMSSQKLRAIALQTDAVVKEICDKPIVDTLAALDAVRRSYEAARAAGITRPPS